MSTGARRRPSPLALLYLALAVVGLALTWYCNLTYSGADYLGDWFANRASASAALDILVTFVVCCVFYVREARRLRWRFWVPALFAIVSLTVAVAFAFPLFLAVRELRLAALRAGATADHQLDGELSLPRRIRTARSTTGMKP